MENFEELSWWSIVDVQGVFGCFLKWGKEGGMGEASIYSESELWFSNFLAMFMWHLCPISLYLEAELLKYF